jgi:uncharacterized membrane protein
MSWIFITIISVIAASVANLYQKMVMRDEKSDAIASAIAFQVVTTILYAIFALIKGFRFPELSLAPYFLGTMALYAAGTICFFRAIKLIEASEMSIITGAGPIITITASMIFLKDVLTPTQLIGSVFILTAVILINFKKHKIIINRGTWLALLGTSLFGFAVIFDTIIIRAYDAISFIPIGTLGTTIIMMMWYPNKIPVAIQVLKKVNKNLLIYSTVYVAGAIAFYMAIGTGAMVGQVSSISRSSIILTVLLASVLLKERKDIGKKIIGAILTTIGVILVSS